MIKRFFADGFLYLEFSFVFSLLFILLGSPVLSIFFGPLFKRFSEDTVLAVLSFCCWLALSGFMGWLEYTRGFRETRTQPFRLAKIAWQKLASMLFILLPLIPAYLTYENPETGKMQGIKFAAGLAETNLAFSWMTRFFSAETAVIGLVLTVLGTYGVVMVCFFRGRRKYERRYPARVRQTAPPGAQMPE